MQKIVIFTYFCFTKSWTNKYFTLTAILVQTSPMWVTAIILDITILSY